MSNLYLKITRKADGSYNISGSPRSLEALGAALQMKARNPESYFVTLVEHGPTVTITVPGIECPQWLKP